MRLKLDREEVEEGESFLEEELVVLAFADDSNVTEEEECPTMSAPEARLHAKLLHLMGTHLEHQVPVWCRQFLCRGRRWNLVQL